MARVDQPVADPPVRNEGKKKKEMTPEVVHERFAQYLKDQDLDGLGSLFDEDAMFVPGPGQEPVYGRAAIKEALKPYLVSPGAMEVWGTSVHQNGDLAMVQPYWRITGESGTVEGKAVEVMRRTSEGDWVYIIDSPYGV
jgi:ketosteroid isomerase-like protein